MALSGGGARGLAHIPVFEALDEMGITPVAIAGTSIGSLLGAGYAAGLSGDFLRQFILDSFKNRNSVASKLWQLRPRTFSELTKMTLTQVNPQRVLEIFSEDLLPETFEELKIPLITVSGDYYSGSEVLHQSGPLLPAIAGSIAIPFLFKPVAYDNNLLIDGGVVNPMPFDCLPKDLDFILAVDVVGRPARDEAGTAPSGIDCAVGAMQILMQTIAREKHRERAPDLVIRPKIEPFKVMDFMKADQILAACDTLRDETVSLVKQKIGLLND